MRWRRRCAAHALGARAFGGAECGCCCPAWAPATLPDIQLLQLRPPLLPASQLLTRRNQAFFLPSDRAPAGSAVEAQLEALTRRELDAAAVAEEAERWERVRGEGWAGSVRWRLAPYASRAGACGSVAHRLAAQPAHHPQAARDLSLVGPPTEDVERKQQRIAAMLDKRLRPTVQVGGPAAGRPDGGRALCCRPLGPLGRMHGWPRSRCYNCGQHPAPCLAGH